MRKIVLVLAVLFLAAPTWATVSVDCVVLDVPGPNYVVAVNYTMGGGDANLPRAFGIRIDVNNGAVIEDIDVNDTDYYIFPGSIDINDTTGEVDSNGTAVAEGGVGQGYVILEMGSLYAATDPKHTTAPPSSGLLCTFEVSKECVVSLSPDTDRGGVVMENLNYGESISLNGCTLLYDDCFPQNHPDWAEYDAMGRPPCWCYPRQCHGDADGILNQEFMKTDHWVSLGDLQIMAIGWTLADTDPNFSTFICGDFKHASETQFGILHSFRVGLKDLQEMAKYWKGPNGGMPVPDANCLTVY